MTVLQKLEGKYTIKFSGRTERDAIKEGEKPFFLEVTP